MFYRIRVFLLELKKSKNSILFSLKKHRFDDLYYLTKLAKCCHILDKGCHTVPFEKNHSRNIYDEAKKNLAKITNNDFIDDPCYVWCLSRIKLYEKLQSEDIITTPCYIDTENYSDVDSQKYNKFIASAVSVRRFNDKEINNSIIENCIMTAQTAPSSCFRQTVRCYAIKSKEKIHQLSKNIAGLTGFSNGVPLLFCITSDIRSYDCIDRDLAYIDASLFAQNLILSLRANNIYSVFLNFQQATQYDINNVKEKLELPDYEKIIVFVASGYSNYVSEKPIRLNFNKVGKIYE